ncbi:MAG: hypothetical protein KGI03_00960 [Patescibacteria group bacterium]|nr:hypothetical protein [Patescibacteria group bacterium]
MNASTIASIAAGVAIAVSGWFASQVSTLANRVDTVQTAEAATQQQTTDVDARLTRIENKLDTVISKGGYGK